MQWWSVWTSLAKEPSPKPLQSKEFCLSCDYLLSRKPFSGTSVGGWISLSPEWRPLRASALKQTELGPPPPSGQQLSALLLIIKELLLLRHRISSQKPSRNYRLKTKKALLIWWKKEEKVNKDFFLETVGWAWLRQQGPSVGTTPRGPSRTCSRSLRVCLCGSSGRWRWRRFPPARPVWSQLEGFLLCPRHPSQWLFAGPKYGHPVGSTPELQFRDLVKRNWDMTKSQNCPGLDSPVWQHHLQVAKTSMYITTRPIDSSIL